MERPYWLAPGRKRKKKGATRIRKSSDEVMIKRRYDLWHNAAAAVTMPIHENETRIQAAL
jgi:hypothetical protein